MRNWIAMAAGCLCATLAAAASVQVMVQDDSGKPLADAVVFLESAAAQAAVRPAQGVEVVQQARVFKPAVTVVPRGTAVRFPNNDTVRHHVYSFSPAKKFELKLYSGTSANPVTFDTPGIVVLGCNIHDDMVAWVVVVDTPYFATATADGRATLANVPAGNYRLRAWHASLPVDAAPREQALAVSEGPATSVSVRVIGAQP